MNESEIKSLLENVEVTPSARCWDAIEGNLAAAAGGTAAASSAAKGAAGKAAGKISATAAKAIIGASAAGMIAAGAIICAIVLPDDKETTQETISKPLVINEKTIENKDDSQTENETVEIESVTAEPTSDIVPEQADLSETDAKSEISPETTTPVTAVNEQPSRPTPAPVSQVAPSSPAPSPAPAQPKPAVTKPTTPAATATPATGSAIPSREDPVLAGRNDLPNTPPIAIEIPNVITPNGDGYNDLFVIKGIENCENSKLIIRTRNGAVVFQTTDYQNNWNAENAPDGSYYYQFFYTINGIQQTRSGMLTIMR